MRHLPLILILLLPGIAAAQSAPVAPGTAPPSSASAPAESTAGEKPASPEQSGAQPAVTPGKSTPAAAPSASSSPSTLPPAPPSAPPNAGPGAGPASTTPANPGSETTGSAPTKWPTSADKPEAAAAPAPKPAAAAITPKPRRRARAAIKRSSKPLPAPKPRSIPINPATPAKYAGTYRIESWQSFQERGLYHFFYLQPGGAFLLGAEWPGRETSRAAGEWKASGNRLSLSGTVEVSTNKGGWRVPFQRSFHISLGEKGIQLEPLPEKNRFGLLGWPNAYFFFRTKISPNLPSRKIPMDDDEVDALIGRLRG